MFLPLSLPPRKTSILSTVPIHQTQPQTLTTLIQDHNQRLITSQLKDKALPDADIRQILTKNANMPPPFETVVAKPTPKLKPKKKASEPQVEVFDNATVRAHHEALRKELAMEALQRERIKKAAVGKKPATKTTPTKKTPEKEKKNTPAKNHTNNNHNPVKATANSDITANTTTTAALTTAATTAPAPKAPDEPLTPTMKAKMQNIKDTMAQRKAAKVTASTRVANAAATGLGAEHEDEEFEVIDYAKTDEDETDGFVMVDGGDGVV